MRIEGADQGDTKLVITGRESKAKDKGRSKRKKRKEVCMTNSQIGKDLEW